jgi:hypothetical protein
MTIEHVLNQPFADGLHKSLLDAMLAEDRASGQLAELLGQDSEVVARRLSLGNKRERLVKIKRKLDDFASGNLA